MLTTSQRIALRFTVTIALIIFVLWLLINLAFFGAWRRREQALFRVPQQLGEKWAQQMHKMQKRFEKKWGPLLWPRNMLFADVWGDIAAELSAHTLFANLAYIEGERYLYWVTADARELVIIDISPVVWNQIALLWITLISALISSGVGYLIAVSFVKKWLRDLHTLAAKAQTIDIDSLHQSRIFAHLPPHDEIQIVSRAIETMTTKLDNQVTSIKQFVANVSHEFKTPLMSLQSTIELADKMNQYETLFPQINEQIKIMRRLLETLTMLMQTHQTTHLEKESLHIAAVVDQLVSAVRITYPQITYTLQIPSDLHVMTHQWLFERIVTNLLDNAGKFTPAWWTVVIWADTYGLTIRDTGVGMSPEQLMHMREPFWQGDAARGTTWFGLWWAIVKQCAELLGRNIEVTSVVGEGTTVTLTW